MRLYLTGKVDVACGVECLGVCKPALVHQVPATLAASQPTIYNFGKKQLDARWTCALFFAMR